MSEITKVKLTDVELLPNIRTNYDAVSIDELSQSIKENGIITPLLLRVHPSKKGKFQLVAGKRRFLAAEKAKLESIPVHVREILDDDIEQLQVLENLQRMDVHPMDEAVGYKMLLQRKLDKGKSTADQNVPTIQELAKKVGKPGTYVAARLKLNDLIADYIKAFREGRMNMENAVKISRLTETDQKNIYKSLNHSTGTITINDWNYKKFLGDLTQAPFDINDPDLDKKMGICTTCKFNTATSAVLFPEQATKATCMNSGCFKHKADVGFDKRCNEILNDPTVVLIGDNYGLSKEAEVYTKKGHKVLTKHGYNEVDPPEMEERDWVVDEDDSAADQEKEWQKYLKGYQKELDEHEKKISSGKFQKAFVVEGEDKGKIKFVEVRKSSASASSKVSKSKVESGEVTAEDIKSVVQGIREREKRAKELDYEKVSAKISDEIQKHKSQKSVTTELSKDETASMVVSFFRKVGDYSAHRRIDKDYLKGNERDYIGAVQKLNPKQIAHAVRQLLYSEYQSSHAESFIGSKVLRALAVSAGIDVKAIEKEQAAVAATRAERVEKRIKDLQAQVKPTAKKAKK